MPMDVRAVTAAGAEHGNPFVGPLGPPVSVRVDVSVLTNTAVDQYGYLKPGTPLTRGGILPGASPAFVYGCVAEATKVHTNNTSLAGVTRDIDVAVITIGAVNRAILEDNLGRVLTADEIAAFDRAGSKMVLLY
jgi:hypothetical protein